jgi:hypothetical protein
MIIGCMGRKGKIPKELNEVLIREIEGVTKGK